MTLYHISYIYNFFTVEDWGRGGLGVGGGWGSGVGGEELWPQKRSRY